MVEYTPHEKSTCYEKAKLTELCYYMRTLKKLCTIILSILAENLIHNTKQQDNFYCATGDMAPYVAQHFDVYRHFSSHRFRLGLSSFRYVIRNAIVWLNLYPIRSQNLVIKEHI